MATSLQLLRAELREVNRLSVNPESGDAIMEPQSLSQPALDACRSGLASSVKGDRPESDRMEAILGVVPKNRTENSRKIKPFSTGSEYDHWVHQNCERCSKYNSGDGCEIDLALFNAFCAEGYVSGEIWKRLGQASGICTERRSK